MSYQKHNINKSIRQLNERINYLLLQPEHKKQAVSFYTEIRDSIIAYVQHKESLDLISFTENTAPLLEIIKKQALIIKAAKIEYPTINQSLGHIQDIYLSSTGEVEKMGFQKIHDIEIPII